MSKSAEELEHEVEATRGRLETTLSDLSSRLNPSRLAEELTGTGDPGGAVGLTAERLTGALRANPLPALLIGAGLAFIAYDVLGRQAERRRLRILSDEALRRPPDATLPGNRPDRLEDKLDDALEETFPGSDPVSVRITK
jgi:hypothetical protein